MVILGGHIGDSGSTMWAVLALQMNLYHLFDRMKPSGLVMRADSWRHCVIALDPTYHLLGFLNCEAC